jgi:serine/threonine protein phosphatase PrpC
MSTVSGTLAETPIPAVDAVGAAGRSNRRPRPSGTVLAEAEMSAVAAFDFAGGSAAVISNRSPLKSSPNEDVAALWQLGPSGGVLAIADGLGGHAGGERASRLAIETIQESLKAAVASAENGAPEELRTAILNGIEAANRSVRELGCGAATTLALVEIQDRMIRSYHVGDSAVLVTGQRGKLKLQTISHSPIGYAVEAGLIKEEDAIHHEARHVISNVIGSEQMRIEMGPPVEMARRDTLVLASDGLLDNLLPSEIVELVRSGPLEQAVGDLAEEAQRRMTSQLGAAPSKPDDLTVIAFRPS